VSVDSGGASTGNVHLTQRTFPGLTPERIDHFEFQVRDDEWVEFNHLWADPGTSLLAAADEPDSQETPDNVEASEKLAEWLEKLPRISTHNQTALAVGPLMIFELSSDEALEATRQTWPKLKHDQVKTGLLKTFAFARHPRVLDVLDLGARDRSKMVREYAYGYLQNYAMRDFRNPKHDYAAWRRGNADDPVEEVLEANCRWLVSQLREQKPVNRQ